MQEKSERTQSESEKLQDVITSLELKVRHFRMYIFNKSPYFGYTFDPLH